MRKGFLLLTKFDKQREIVSFCLFMNGIEKIQIEIPVGKDDTLKARSVPCTCPLPLEETYNDLWVSEEEQQQDEQVPDGTGSLFDANFVRPRTFFCKADTLQCKMTFSLGRLQSFFSSSEYLILEISRKGKFIQIFICEKDDTLFAVLSNMIRPYNKNEKGLFKQFYPFFSIVFYTGLFSLCVWGFLQFFIHNIRLLSVFMIFLSFVMLFVTYCNKYFLDDKNWLITWSFLVSLLGIFLYLNYYPF